MGGGGTGVGQVKWDEKVGEMKGKGTRRGREGVEKESEGKEGEEKRKQKEKERRRGGEEGSGE